LHAGIVIFDGGYTEFFLAEMVIIFPGVTGNVGRGPNTELSKELSFASLAFG
jgi:hypothetical protein